MVESGQSVSRGGRGTGRGDVSFKCLAVLFITLTVFSGCRKREIVLLSSEDAGISPDQEWILIRTPYVTLRADADEASAAVSYARSGEIFLVTGRATQKSADGRDVVWYKTDGTDGGWVDGSQVELYDTKPKAESASREADSRLE